MIGQAFLFILIAVIGLLYSAVAVRCGNDVRGVGAVSVPGTQSAQPPSDAMASLRASALIARRVSTRFRASTRHDAVGSRSTGNEFEEERNSNQPHALSDSSGC